MAFDEKNQDLIERFVNGELSEAEKIAFDKRCQEDPAFARQLGIFLAIREAAKEPPTDEIEDFVKDLEKKRTLSRNVQWVVWIGIGLLVAWGIYYFFSTRNTTPPQEKINNQIFAENFEKPRDTLVLDKNQLTQRVASTLTDDGKKRLKVAIEKFYEENYDDARDELKSITEDYGDVFMANFYLGASYIYLEEYEAALQEFRNVRDGLPLEDNLDIHDQTTWYQALAYIKLNRTEEAIQALNELIENDTKYKAKAEAILEKIQ